MNLTHQLSILPLLVSLTAGPLAAQGFAPQDAVRRMQVPPGFQVKLAACEPDIRQPVTMDFDDRGRLWVLQYLQYPTPAGLKPVQVDQYLRTTYDRVPEPPPHGPRGADVITILEDTHGDGHYHKVKDFVTGLNLASGMAVGHGGVFVAQPPYLLFYPDRNGDDIPDSAPEVLLTGFGMEDAHAFPNSLQWGPDGWLYGAQGSTVTSHVRGLTFQQGIWRYHPITREFELFAEGGGNTWGVDFDSRGRILAGTNFANVAMLHQVQGAYYVKNFGKHGALHNPHAYGYFDHVPYTGFRGGHVTCGGIIYQGGSFPKEFEGTYIAANPLANAVYWHVLEPKGSSFTAHFGGELLLGHDTWFRPVDCLTGPDGSLFVADWYDKRINHVDPVDNWDRTNGRIYKIEAAGTRPAAGLPLARLSSKELVGLLGHANDWYRREARRLLAERRDPAVLPLLRDMLLTRHDGLSLQALWALYVSGGFDDSLAEVLLHHPNEDVRAWTIRFLGDQKKITPALQAQLVALARTEPSGTVRSQLACSCKRLPGPEALPMVRELLHRDEDVDDPQIPLLLWWALENKVVSDREQVLSLLDSPAAWHSPIIHQFILERLARRLVAEGREADLNACARLLTLAPGPAEVDLLLRGMEQGLEGGQAPHLTSALEQQIARLWQQPAPSLALVRLCLSLGQARALERTLELVRDVHTAAADRLALMEVLGQRHPPEALPVLLSLLAGQEPANIRQAALAALASYPDQRVPETVLALYPQLPAGLRAQAQSLLCSRRESARQFLLAVDAGRIAAREVPLDQLRRVLLFQDPQLQQLVAKHWGQVGPEPTGAKIARIRSVQHILSLGRGHPVQGRLLFQKNCATCHTLFGEGAKIGPDLTSADRKDRDFLVSSVVDPSAVIRPEYTAYLAVTAGGRVLNGLLADSSPGSVTLLDAKNERTLIPREELEELKPSAESLMPEKLLDPLDDQQICDLFSYLQADSPPAPGAGPAKEQAPLKVCLVSGSLEYQSDDSLAQFQKYLEEHYPVKCTRAFRKSDDDLPGLENLETCDVMLLFTRRLTISGEQLERVKKYCRAGKPIVAVRTSSHAFQNWLALDHEVLGGNYQNHYPPGPLVQVHIVEQAKNHPILEGVKPFRSPGSLYRNPGLGKDVAVLLTGSVPGHQEPVAWVHLNHGGRVFYTSLGHPQDFTEESFRRLLTNALFWTARRTPARKE
ncbi:MAG: ThuA domain-containing protein [Planctomycetes bacterium]|nr:ThuA domain-containing protein [Planctomycetota bacterium]